MKRLLIILLFVFGYGFSQTNCELCVEQNGFYCGDDPANWTQYSPNGCVPNGYGGLFYLNDGWLDCVDGSDEDNATPTTMETCNPYVEPCDTIYVTEYETIFDTIVEIQVVTEYETIFDTIVEYETEWIYIEEFIDCETGMPCNTSIVEIIKESKRNKKIYNLLGKEIIRPRGLYIQNGEVKYKLN